MKLSRRGCLAGILALPCACGGGEGGGGGSGDTGSGEMATGVSLGGTSALAVAPDGGVYFASNEYVRKVSPDGRLATIAGPPDLPGRGIRGLTVGADGSLYAIAHVADFDYALFRIDPSGAVTAVAGEGPDTTGPIDGGLGTEILFTGNDEELRDVEAGPDGRDDPCQDAVPPEPVCGAPARRWSPSSPTRRS